MEEKRAFIRLDANVRVYWKLIVERPGVLGEFQDVSEDISAGGLCLAVSEQLMIGDRSM